MITTIIFWAIAVVLLAVSLVSDRKKTTAALMKAWKALYNILPQFLGIIVIVGILLAVLDTETISKILGTSSGFLGVLLASVVGAITLMPGFIAFPTAALLLKGGAGYMQMGAFISSLMMVGVVTLPVEIGFFNRRIAILRNVFAYIFSFIVALVIGLVMSL